jgi:hypothetical protein
MQITIVALMASIPQPICREELVDKSEIPMQAYQLTQAALADWKAHSIYAGEQWAIGRTKCVAGDYVIKRGDLIRVSHLDQRPENRARAL